MANFDAVVVGSGPNGLAAAIALAQRELRVLVVEANDTAGGGARSAALTLPGFVHDTCSAVHPMALASPFFRTLPLDQFGLDWLHPEIPLAHPLDGGKAAILRRSLDETAAGLGDDADAYRRLMGPPVADAAKLFGDLLGPFGIPRHPVAALRFGLRAVHSGAGLANAYFHGEPAKALLAGIAAHSVLPLTQSPSAAIGVMLGAAAHAVGWPSPKGGSQKIADALGGYFRSLGGEIETGRRVTSVDELPPAKAVLLDVTPRQVLAIAGHKLSAHFRRRLERYRYGPGCFKIDWALDGPVPWANEDCRRAGTLHLGGTLAELTASEAAVWEGRAPEKPYVLFAQPGVFDATRAPAGKQTGWAYCHVPHGSTADMTGRIEAQVERFAPGFRDRILARHTMDPAALEAHNANYVGGDITGGVIDWRQLFTRPVASLDPYHLTDGLFLASASTPPGGGVHGMCGFHAAKSALRRVFGKN
jgi:phytoene dehydrogenase-like protein